MTIFNIKTLRVSIIGEPNAGKSSLINSLFKKKHSIVSRKAQTTIKKYSVSMIKDKKQIIFTDTPGIMPYKNKLNRSIFKETSNSAFESDFLVLLIDFKRDSVDKINLLINYIKTYKINYLIALNKIDLMSEELFFNTANDIKIINKDSIFLSMSVKNKKGLSQLTSYLFNYSKFKENKISKNNELHLNKFYLSEVVREKVLQNIHDEIPFNLKFNTDKLKVNNDKSITAYVTIKFQKESHKPIILGKNGHNIKKISMQARQDLEKNLNKKFHLFIFLKLVNKKHIKSVMKEI